MFNSAKNLGQASPQGLCAEFGSLSFTHGKCGGPKAHRIDF